MVGNVSGTNNGCRSDNENGIRSIENKFAFTLWWMLWDGAQMASQASQDGLHGASGLKPA